ncbi:hypothetical protein [Paraburkholderia lycopersici]|uniref:DNA binding domain-containing protein, excisionase family n=1 Tax=Paraburkholderia lycopersici TaxID=416944 RepID=A0A1G6LUK4_9BURK|nr:hypothetical protein [Paraburkholderia lycopersici]SDC46901.1 hypothetical protein SAMN05421548_10745 [Paraburkholderia lycopersici]
MPIYLRQGEQGAEIVWLAHWSIRETSEGARHFVGYSMETSSGRVSSKIFHLDRATRTAQTLSGRIYQLVGPSGHSVDAEYVFNTVAKDIGNGKPWRDVTAELIPDCQERKAVTADCEEMTLEAAARLLTLSRAYVKSLISDDKIPSRVGDGGVQWIPIAALTEYRTKMRAELETVLEAIMCESERPGPYGAGFPLHGKSGGDETE